MKTLFIVAMIALAVFWLLMVVIWEAKKGLELLSFLFKAINFLSLFLIIVAVCSLCKVEFAILIGKKLAIIALGEVIFARILLASCITGKF